MTIKRITQLNTLILFFCILVVSGIFVFSSLTTTRTENIMGQIANLESESISLFDLTQNYVQNPSLDAQTKWQDENEKIKEILDGPVLKIYQENGSFQNLKKSNNTIQTLFDQIRQAENNPRLQQRLSNQILFLTQKFVNETSDLEKVLFSESKNTQQQAVFIFFVSLVVLFAVIISILVYIFRAISRPIIDLTKTVKYIENGNFFVQAPNRPKNEIGVLGTAFNSMVSKLRERTSTLENINAKDEALLNSMGEGVVAVDYDYNVIAINKMAQDLLGYTSPELLGKNFIEGIIQLDENGNKVPDNDRPLILAMNSGKTISASDKYFVNKTGEKFPISLTSAPIIFNSKVSGAVVLFSDISLRKKKDEEMNKLAAIVRSSEDAIIGKTLDGIITSWNRGAEKIYKYTEKEVIGKPVSILAPEDHKDEIFHLLEKVKKGEHIEHYETVRQKKRWKYYSSVSYDFSCR